MKQKYATENISFIIFIFCQILLHLSNNSDTRPAVGMEMTNTYTVLVGKPERKISL
jgi:hypothetical protein